MPPEFVTLADGTLSKPSRSAPVTPVALVAATASGYFAGACDEPACAEGDLLVASVAYYIEDVPAPTMVGWSRFAQITQPGDGPVELALFWKRRGASAGGPYSPDLSAGTYFLTSVVAFSHAADPVSAVTAGGTGTPCSATLAALSPNPSGKILLSTARWVLGHPYSAPAGFVVQVRDDQERVTYVADPADIAGSLTLTIPDGNTLAAAWCNILPGSL